MYLIDYQSLPGQTDGGRHRAGDSCVLTPASVDIWLVNIKFDADAAFPLAVAE